MVEVIYRIYVLWDWMNSIASSSLASKVQVGSIIRDTT